MHKLQYQATHEYYGMIINLDRLFTNWKSTLSKLLFGFLVSGQFLSSIICGETLKIIES